MRILITGGQGMLARTLAQKLALRQAHVLASPSRTELDITNAHQVSAYFARFQPEAVLHCAAFTKVDLCEDEPELAYAVNNHGSANVACACQQTGARLIAFSTDYVFDGKKDGPYSEFDQAGGAINVYGQSKWAGECAIRLNCPNHVIARVSWLYGPGGPSFVHTMLKLHEKGMPALRVVNDQKGNPTSTEAVANAVCELLDRPDIKGTIHLTCEGETTWYGFAKEIFARAGLSQEVEPVTSAEYVTKARRPANSCLAKTRLAMAGLSPMPGWQEALAGFLKQELPALQQQK